MNTGNHPANPVQDAGAWQSHGLTLREHYASVALPAIIALYSKTSAVPPYTFAEWCAMKSFEIAAAMVSQADKERI